MLIRYLIPGALTGNSPVFSRIKGDRATHIANESKKDEEHRITYDGVHLLAHLKEVYTVENVISRHTTWTAVLIGNRAPGAPLNDWLDNMRAIAHSFTQAGNLKQRKQGLNK